MKHYRVYYFCKISFLLFLFQFLSCTKPVNKQSHYNLVNQNLVQKPANLTQTLYISLVDHGKRLNDFMHENEFQEVKFLNADMIIGKGFTIDYKLLKSNIDRNYPSATEFGVCYIDLEAPYILPLLHDDPESKSFKDAINLYVNVVKYCKKVRPNVKWGHYGMPYTTFFDNKKDMDSNDKMGKIFKEVDFLFPSIYLYEDNVSSTSLKNWEYMDENLQKSIEIGIKYKKPVIPFVMHRFNNNTKRLEFSEMEDSFWKNYISEVLSINYKGKFVDGIVWWGADTYFYTSPEGRNVRKNLKVSSAQFQELNDEMLLRKLKIISPLFKKQKK